MNKREANNCPILVYLHFPWEFEFTCYGRCRWKAQKTLTLIVPALIIWIIQGWWTWYQSCYRWHCHHLWFWLESSQWYPGLLQSSQDWSEEQGHDLPFCYKVSCFKKCYTSSSTSHFGRHILELPFYSRNDLWTQRAIHLKKVL